MARPDPKKVILAASLLAASALTGCILFPSRWSEYETPLAKGVMALERCDPAPCGIDFAAAYPQDKTPLVGSIDRSLEYLSHASSKRYFPYLDITHERAVASLKRFKQIVIETRSPSDFDRRIRKEFVMYRSRGWDGRGAVLFTAYYTPIFDASRKRTSKFKHPLYRLPPDLLKDKEGKTLGRKTPSGHLVSYYTRGQIVRDRPLKGQEIAWLADRFECFVVTIEGSAKLRLPNGRFLEIGYAGNNGYPYTSIGRILAKEDRIPQHEVSLQRISRFFKKHPRETDKYLFRNKRYVFFVERKGEPRGSLNVPVTSYHSIATDKAVFPRACIAAVSTKLPCRDSRGRIQAKSSCFFALDQDTGGGIRAAGRCDIYMGVGDEAGELAGRQKNKGFLVYLFLKE